MTLGKRLLLHSRITVALACFLHFCSRIGYSVYLYSSFFFFFLLYIDLE